MRTACLLFPALCSGPCWDCSCCDCMQARQHLETSQRGSDQYFTTLCLSVCHCKASAGKCVSACLFVCVCECLSFFVLVWLYVFMCVHMYVFLNVATLLSEGYCMSAYVCLSVYIPVCVCVCLCVCMCVSVYLPSLSAATCTTNTKCSSYAALARVLTPAVHQHTFILVGIFTDNWAVRGTLCAVDTWFWRPNAQTLKW